MNQLNRIRKINRFYPSIIIIALVSHYIYYYNVFHGMYPGTLHFVIVALISLVLGYLFGSIYRFEVGYRIVFSREKKNVLYSARRAGIFLTIIGIIAHLYFYSTRSFRSYAEGYGVSRGSGYITIFFNFWLVGMVILEYLSEQGFNRFKIKWTNRLLVLAYVYLYVFVLIKRRQIIILFLAILGIWGYRFSKPKKIVLYIGGLALVIIMLIFGRVRGYIDSFGFEGVISYITNNYNSEWIAIDNFEGQYISRTLNDTVHYVEQNGYDPSILLGVLFCMVPRSLLGGAKPVAFPEWYTKHFFISDYLRGTGYAGSLVGELYLIGGFFTLIIGYLIIGYICSRIQEFSKKNSNITATLVYSLFIYTILLLPRYDLASLLIDTVFLYLPIILLCGGIDISNNQAQEGNSLIC